MTRGNPKTGVGRSESVRRHPDPLPVSVIIAAYDAQQFISETLASVRAQTARPAEIIVVDDGSSDQTACIAESFGATVLRNRHGGPALARNTGIRAASCEWVAFLDADDLWLADKLEAQWSAVEACPGAGLVFTDFSQGIPGEIRVPSLLSWRRNYQQVLRHVRAPGVVSCDRQSLIQGFLEGNFILLSTALVRRSLALELGLFDPGIMGCEDRDFFLRVLHRSDTAVVERCLVHRRLHGGNLSEDPIRMALSAAAVADRVFARPERYPPGAVAHYRIEQPAVLKQAGIRLLEQGRLAEARRALGKSLRGHFSGRSLVAYVCALLGSPSLYRASRQLWRSLGQDRPSSPPPSAQEPTGRRSA
ncbi:MAG: glycosyltransferase family 2 protein [bacterium]